MLQGHYRLALLLPFFSFPCLIRRTHPTPKFRGLSLPVLHRSQEQRASFLPARPVPGAVRHPRGRFRARCNPVMATHRTATVAAPQVERAPTRWTVKTRRIPLLFHLRNPCKISIGLRLLELGADRFFHRLPPPKTSSRFERGASVPSRRSLQGSLVTFALHEVQEPQCAVQPRSIAIEVPVIPLPRSVQRNATRSATSSGSNSRLTACRARSTCSITSCSEIPWVFA